MENSNIAKSSYSKTIGCILLLAGTMMGGGILALPLVSASMGFIPASIILFTVCAITGYSALLILELILAFPEGSHFDTIAASILGRTGKIIMNLSIMCLLYALTTAYINTASVLLTTKAYSLLHLAIPYAVWAVIFTVIFGLLVYLGTHFVDWSNRFVLFFVLFLLMFIIAVLLRHVHAPLFTVPKHAGKALFLNLPVFLTVFGFQSMIPTAVEYLGRHKRQRLIWILFFAPFIPCVIYILWDASVLSTISLNGAMSFHNLFALHRSEPVAFMIKYIEIIQNSSYLTMVLNVFSNIVVISSFLCVTVGLFDFMADFSKRDRSNKKHRVQIALLTYVPPLVFAILYPAGFVKLLRYAAIPLAVIALILPAIMVYENRKRSGQIANFRAPGGVMMLALVLIVGVVIVLNSIIASII